MTVRELREELGRLDGDLLVRFANGRTRYPGVYVMWEDYADHVDIGSPFPVEARLAEIAKAVRRIDRRSRR